MDTAVVCGLSMGGYVAFELWRAARPRVAALVLANTKAEPDSPEGAAGAAGAGRTPADGGPRLPRRRAAAAPRRRMRPPSSPSACEDDRRADAGRDRGRGPRDGRAAGLGAGPRDDRRAHPRDHRHLDRLIPPDVTAGIAGRVPGAELLRIEGAGHLSNLEAPEAFGEALDGVLNRARRVAPHRRAAATAGRRPARRLAHRDHPRGLRAAVPVRARRLPVAMRSTPWTEGWSVLVAAPTGSGKTVVAEFAIERALDRGGKAFYTTPLKALSNQKFGDLVDKHGAGAVGLLTGDNAINPEASDRRHDDRGAPQHAVRTLVDAHGAAHRRDGRGALPAGPVPRRRVGGGADPPAAVGERGGALRDDLERRGVRRMDHDPPRRHTRRDRGAPSGAARSTTTSSGGACIRCTSSRTAS